jgi:lysine/ornithine N-monooxygenase
MEVSLQAGKAVSSASVGQDGKFVLKVEKRTSDFVDYINANYVLVATGSSQQVWAFLFAPRFVSSYLVTIS